MQKLYELRRYVKFDLYTVGKSYVLQLFELDVEPNDLDVSCIWENDNLDVEKLLDEAIEWCRERITLPFISYSNIREEMLSAASLEELECIRKKYKDEIDNIYLPIFEDMVNNGHHFEKDIGKVIN